MLSQLNIKISPKRKLFLSFVFFLLITVTNLVYSQNSDFTVVLDAGHGGKDPGTLGLGNYKKSYESDIALKVALKVGSFLKTETNINTVYTRDDCTFIELHKRGKIANKKDADLFISIHCNAAVNKNAYGTTTYVLGMGKTAKNLELAKRENDVILLEDDREKNYSYDPNSQEFLIGLTLMQEDYLDKSIEFADIVQNKFKTVAKRKDRGVNQGNLAVLYDTYMPSVLIEIGFLTNKEEECFLHTTQGQSKIAEAIYKAIKTYKGRIEANRIESTAVDTPIIINTNSEKKFYRIQIATSKKNIETIPSNFHGLQNVERIKVGNLYKYFYGVSSDLSKARKMRLTVIKKGYKDAFISKFSFDNSTGDVYKLKYDNPFKKKTKKPKKKPKKKTTTSYTDNDEVIFKVQISSSVTKIATKAYNFKGLKSIERVKTGKYYKYYYGETTSYSAVKKSHKTAQNKGYTGAFIIALKNGKKVSVRDVLRDK